MYEDEFPNLPADRRNGVLEHSMIVIEQCHVRHVLPLHESPQARLPHDGGDSLLEEIEAGHAIAALKNKCAVEGQDAIKLGAEWRHLDFTCDRLGDSNNFGRHSLSIAEWLKRDVKPMVREWLTGEFVSNAQTHSEIPKPSGR